MADYIKLPFWPRSHDCLDWSQDNEIAVVGGEKVAILSPMPNLTTAAWETTLVKVNGFTAAELLRRDPMPTRNFSIGEELSNREATSAKWSPSGLARHKRCALAVLTANHVLSIWAPDGPPRISTSWKRKLIINNVVREHYNHNHQWRNGAYPRDLPERIQRTQRITAFAWSSPLHGNRGDGRFAEAVEWGEHFLAVSTAGGLILFLHVESPHTNSPTGSEWRATVVSTFNTANSETSASIDGSTSGIASADHLAFGKWETGQNEATEEYQVASLAYIAKGQLFTTTVLGSADVKPHVVEVFGQACRHFQDRNDITGPLLFIPNANTRSLITFGVDTMLKARLIQDQTAHEYSSHPLDGRWDDVSGLAFTHDHERTNFAHFVSPLSSVPTNMSAVALPLEEDKIGPVFRPKWPQSIVQSRKALGKEHSIGQAVQERVWGTVSSPCGQYIALCFSLHPSAMISHVSPAEQSCVISITKELHVENKLFPAVGDIGALSTEVVIYALQHCRMRQSPPDRAFLVNQIEEALPRKVDESSLAAAPGANMNDDTLAIVRQLRLALYSHQTMRTVKANCLVDIAMNDSKQHDGTVRAVVQHLLSVVLRLSADMLAPDDQFSASIRKIFVAISNRINVHAQVTIGGTAPEQCNTCRQDIPFESLKWAKCVGGHEFSRCSLSFVAIQETDKSKSCGVCRFKYLGAEAFSRRSIAAMVEDVQMTGLPGSEGSQSIRNGNTWAGLRRTQEGAKPTLAWLLFSACDLCLYCGGKFIN